MVAIRPFRAIRPRGEYVDRVAAPPYDVVSREEAEALAGDNPHSFLHIDRAEIDLDPSVPEHDPRVYRRAAANLRRMMDERVLLLEGGSFLYIYRLDTGGRRQTGLVCCTSIDDYLEGRIKKHEYTRPEKERDRYAHIRACRAHTGPIFLTHRPDPDLRCLLAGEVGKQDPLYDFYSGDGVRHTVWRIAGGETIRRLRQKAAGLERVYIADGHHRSAAAVRVGLEERQGCSEGARMGGAKHFLAILFPTDELQIMPYNRVIRDRSGLSRDRFLNRLREVFRVEPAPEGPHCPRQRHQFGMYLDRNWYRLTAREDTFDGDDPVDSLDVSILQNNLLGPVLNIKDPRTDERLEFIGGNRGPEELEERAGENGVAFALHPTSIDEVLRVSDSGRAMPPKSTWFEPKLRSGIFIHPINGSKPS